MTKCYISFYITSIKHNLLHKVMRNTKHELKQQHVDTRCIPMRLNLGPSCQLSNINIHSSVCMREKRERTYTHMIMYTYMLYIPKNQKLGLYLRLKFHVLVSIWNKIKINPITCLLMFGIL